MHHKGLGLHMLSGSIRSGGGVLHDPRLIIWLWHICICWLWHTYVFAGCGIHVHVFAGCGIHVHVFAGCGISVAVGSGIYIFAGYGPSPCASSTLAAAWLFMVPALQGLYMFVI